MLISLDYELFFGPETGSPENCLLRPTRELVKLLNHHQAKLSLFVDVGYLVKLEEYSQQYSVIRSDLRKIQDQLRHLVEDGHDVQLHIHPHWENSIYDGRRWQIDTQRYRLQDFPLEEVHSIVKKYAETLRNISGHSVFAFRAGGWCIQPFKCIKDALLENGIWLDSTVYERGISTNPRREYDFSQLPEKGIWHFSDEPTIEDKHGEFTEIPISGIKISPFFFWKMAATKKVASSKHVQFGDGNPIANSKHYYFTRLTRPTFSAVAIDGIKAGLLSKSFKYHLSRNPEAVFNVMGHPKSISPYSLEQLDLFLSSNNGILSITYQDLAYLRNTKH